MYISVYNSRLASVKSMDVPLPIRVKGMTISESILSSHTEGNEGGLVEGFLIFKNVIQINSFFYRLSFDPE